MSENLPVESQTEDFKPPIEDRAETSSAQRAEELRKEFLSNSEAAKFARAAGMRSQSDGLKGPQGHRTVQLDPKTMLEVEVVALKRKLADANEKLSLVALNDARVAKQSADKEEAVLMKRLAKQLNLNPGTNVRLVDRAKGVCLIEE